VNSDQGVVAAGLEDIQPSTRHEHPAAFLNRDLGSLEVVEEITDEHVIERRVSEGQRIGRSDHKVGRWQLGVREAELSGKEVDSGCFIPQAQIVKGCPLPATEIENALPQRQKGRGEQLMLSLGDHRGRRLPCEMNGVGGLEGPPQRRRNSQARLEHIVHERFRLLDATPTTDFSELR
jgi:hypothetical protein